MRASALSSSPARSAHWHSLQLRARLSFLDSPLVAMIFVAQVVSLVERTSPLTLALVLIVLLLSALYAYRKLTEETYKVRLHLCIRTCPSVCSLPCNCDHFIQLLKKYCRWSSFLLLKGQLILSKGHFTFYFCRVKCYLNWSKLVLILVNLASSAKIAKNLYTYAHNFYRWKIFSYAKTWRP